MNTQTLTPLGYKTLTIDQVKTHVPAAFSTHADPRVSEKYSFVSTEELLHTFEKLGWTPTNSKQNGLSPYARHTIRLANPAFGLMDLKNDNVKPQLILDNSHNRSSNAMIHLGLFRLVCANGLVVAIPGLASSIKFRHIGVDMEELKKLMEVISNQYVMIGGRISEMQSLELSEEQQIAFVIKAMAMRESAYFVDRENDLVKTDLVLKSINPTEILKPLRPEDNANNLWTVYNRIQEKMVNGQFERKSLKGRTSQPRSITNATRNINFNKALWSIAEEYLGRAEDAKATLLNWREEGVTDAVVVTTKTYTSSKGNVMEVKLLDNLDATHVQVKSLKSGLVFSANVNQLS